MGKIINLGDIDLRLRFDNLHITAAQITYGVFYKPIGRHCHSKTYYEAHLVCGGSGTLIAQGKSYPLKKGSFYMTGPEITHEQLSDDDNLMEEYCLGFDVRRSKDSRDSEASATLFNTRFWIGSDNGVAEALFERLSAESINRRIGYLNNIKNIFSSILVALLRAYTDSAQSAEKALFNPDDKRALIIDQTFLYHCATVSRKGLAEIIGLSERQLQRFLVKQYGKSFSQLKREARRNKAVLLMSQGKDAQKAAALVGYEDMRSFRKLINE